MYINKSSIRRGTFKRFELRVTCGRKWRKADGSIGVAVRQEHLANFKSEVAYRFALLTLNLKLFNMGALDPKDLMYEEYMSALEQAEIIKPKARPPKRAPRGLLRPVSYDTFDS